MRVQPDRTEAGRFWAGEALSLPPGCVVLAAHPDDETIGAAGLLAGAREAHVLHLTSGVPPSRSLWPVELSCEPHEYAALRRVEAETALAWVGIPPERIHPLGGEDQGAIVDAASLTLRVMEVLARVQPPVLVVHAYEGGHPDHDTAALVAHAAVQLLAQDALPVPALVEMATYHACGGTLVTSEFVDADGGGPVQVHVLDPEVQATKGRMFEAYRSQQAVLGMFSTGAERYRPAPRYRFDAPPHEGPLWYEQQGWMEGRRWRSSAQAALTRLGLEPDAWL